MCYPLAGHDNARFVKILNIWWNWFCLPGLFIHRELLAILKKKLKKKKRFLVWQIALIMVCLEHISCLAVMNGKLPLDHTFVSHWFLLILNFDSGIQGYVWVCFPKSLNDLHRALIANKNLQKCRLITDVQPSGVCYHIHWLLRCRLGKCAWVLRKSQGFILFSVYFEWKKDIIISCPL